MERLVTMDKLDLVVLGQVQYNFTVGGVSGQDLGYAAADCHSGGRDLGDDYADADRRCGNCRGHHRDAVADGR